MTEAEWLACGDPQPMLEFLRGKASDRKLRLTAVAFCRLTPDSGRHMDVERLQNNIADAEQIADGVIPPPDPLGHHYGFYDFHHGSGSDLESACHAAMDPSAWDAASGTVKWLGDAMWGEVEISLTNNCLRCIFGNPFRPVAFADSWRSEAAVALASGIYADRAFDRLPVLADALEEAGCDHPDVLAHCRGPEPHARGCWVVDGVLGKV